MLQSYINPTIFKPALTSKLAKEITTERDTEWGNGSFVVCVSYDFPPRYEEISIDRTDIISSVNNYSLEEIEIIREDFKVNVINLRKYPKMTEKDWE